MNGDRGGRHLDKYVSLSRHLDVQLLTEVGSSSFQFPCDDVTIPSITQLTRFPPSPRMPLHVMASLFTYCFAFVRYAGASYDQSLHDDMVKMMVDGMAVLDGAEAKGMPL